MSLATPYLANSNATAVAPMQEYTVALSWDGNRWNGGTNYSCGSRPVDLDMSIRGLMTVPCG